MTKYLEKCDSERVQFHSNTAPGNENKRRASLKKRLNKCVQKISNDGFTAPGNENKGFEFEKKSKKYPKHWAVVKISLPKWREKELREQSPRGQKSAKVLHWLPKTSFLSFLIKVMYQKNRKNYMKKQPSWKDPDVRKWGQASHSSASAQKTIELCKHKK